MYGIRKRQNKYHDIIKQDCVVLDEIFGQFIRINHGSNKDVIDVAFMKYFDGTSHKFGRSWRGANSIYFPLNVGEKHWVAIKIDIINTELVVFDCNLECFSESEMEKFMLPIRTMIPLILRHSNFFGHIADSLNAPWQYRRPRNLPHNTRYVYNFFYAITNCILLQWRLWRLYNQVHRVRHARVWL